MRCRNVAVLQTAALRLRPGGVQRMPFLRIIALLLFFFGQRLLVLPLLDATVADQIGHDVECQGKPQKIVIQ